MSSLYKEQEEKRLEIEKQNENNRPGGYLSKIECSACGYISKPVKWSARWIFAILYLATIVNLFGLLIYFVFTNPYICEKCGERNKLIKILKDGRRGPIKCLSKNLFIGISLVGLVLCIIVFIMFKI